MGIFDVFTNDAQQQAANAIQSGAGTGFNWLSQLTGLGQNAATGYTSAGVGALGTNYGAGQGALSGNIGQGIGALNTNAGAALGALGGGVSQGANALQTNYMAGLSPFMQNYGNAQQGTTALGNALGLNGPAGSAASQQAFWASPAIQAQLDPNGPGMQNVLRGFQQSGQGASGGELAALGNYMNSVVAPGWQNYVSNLQPYLNYSQGAAGGIQSGFGALGSGLAGLYSGGGQGAAGIYTGLGNNTANLLAGLGTGLNANWMGLGNATNADYTGLGSALLNSYTNQGNAAYGSTMTGANAQGNADLANATASANIWGTALGAAGLGAGAKGTAQQGGSSGGGSSPIGNLAQLVSGNMKFFAQGGRPDVGRPSIVGERGPELFVPDQPGTIVPDYAGHLQRMAGDVTPLPINPGPTAGNPAAYGRRTPTDVLRGKGPVPSNLRYLDPLIDEIVGRNRQSSSLNPSYTDRLLNLAA